MTYPKIDKRSKNEQFVDELLRMIPDKKDRNEHRKEIKRELYELENLISIRKEYQGHLEDINNGIFEKNKLNHLSGFNIDYPMDVYKKKCLDTISFVERSIPSKVLRFQTHFESLIVDIKEELSMTESYFYKFIFTKDILENN